MSILDTLALYEVRRIMSRHSDSPPKFEEDTPIDWALLRKSCERSGSKTKPGRVFRQSRKRGLFDETCRAGY
jgi:hypothetical protein